MPIDLNQLAQLIAIAEQANIDELEVSDYQQTIRITCRLPHPCHGHHPNHSSNHSHNHNHNHPQSTSRMPSHIPSHLANSANPAALATRPMVSPVLFSKSAKPFDISATDQQSDSQPADNQQTDDQPTNKQETDHTDNTVKSPMVGTFYRKSSPDAPAFIEENSQVAVGDTLCIIEAMKIMHEVKAEKSGTIKQILVNDGDMVEYDQPLVIMV